MIPPEAVGVAGVVVAVVAAAAYSRLTGEEASVDVDSGEVTFGDEDGKGESAKTENSLPKGGVDTDPSVETAPKHVREISSELTEVKGIGPTREDKLDRAGFITAADLYFASDEELEKVDGIGPHTVEQIRSDIGSAD